MKLKWFKFRCTDLSADSGQPWFVCHLIAPRPRASGNNIQWTAHGATLLQAKLSSVIGMLFSEPDED